MNKVNKTYWKRKQLIKLKFIAPYLQVLTENSIPFQNNDNVVAMINSTFVESTIDVEKGHDFSCDNNSEHIYEEIKDM